MEDKRTIEEILELLDECLRTGLWFEINKDDSATLKEYIQSQDKTKLRQLEKNEMIKIAREHIKDIHEGYKKYLKEQCNVEVSPIDILVRIERDPGKSHIRRLFKKEENEIIINWGIPEEALILYKEEK